MCGFAWAGAALVHRFGMLGAMASDRIERHICSDEIVVGAN